MKISGMKTMNANDNFLTKKIKVNRCKYALYYPSLMGFGTLMVENSEVIINASSPFRFGRELQQFTDDKDRLRKTNHTTDNDNNVFD